MSQENVETVRRIYEASGDAEAVLALYDAEIEWDMTRHPMSQMLQRNALLHGHAALRGWFHEWYAVFEDFEHHLDELIDAGGDYVVSIGTDTGRGRASGVDVNRRIAGVWRVQSGKVTQVVWFDRPEQALEAAGLA